MMYILKRECYSKIWGISGAFWVATINHNLPMSSSLIFSRLVAQILFNGPSWSNFVILVSLEMFCLVSSKLPGRFSIEHFGCLHNIRMEAGLRQDRRCTKYDWVCKGQGLGLQCGRKINFKCFLKNQFLLCRRNRVQYGLRNWEVGCVGGSRRDWHLLKDGYR